MGGQNSTPKPVVNRESASTLQPVSSSQYHDIRNSKYVDVESSSTLSSISSETTTEDTDDRVDPKIIDKPEKSTFQDSPVNILKPLEGLTGDDIVKKSEEMLRKLWKRPHSTWNKITAVTNVSSEKTITDGQLSEKARKDVDHDVDRTIYDIPLEYCHLRIPKSRTSRSCPDPWRRYGAHVKLCEVGGWMPENRNKNSKVIVVKKGSAPPAAPRCKPLMTVEDYLGVLRK